MTLLEMRQQIERLTALTTDMAARLERLEASVQQPPVMAAMPTYVVRRRGRPPKYLKDQHGG